MRLYLVTLGLLVAVCAADGVDTVKIKLDALEAKKKILEEAMASVNKIKGIIDVAKGIASGLNPMAGLEVNKKILDEQILEIKKAIETVDASMANLANGNDIKSAGFLIKMLQEINQKMEKLMNDLNAFVENTIAIGLINKGFLTKMLQDMIEFNQKILDAWQSLEKAIHATNALAEGEKAIANGLIIKGLNQDAYGYTPVEKATLSNKAKWGLGILYPPFGIGLGLIELVKYLQNKDTSTTVAPPTVDPSEVVIYGVTDDPNRLVTVHSYEKGLSNPNTAACTLPDEHGLGLVTDKSLKLGASVKSQDCKTYTCLRVYETDQFDMALISEHFGCWFKDNCFLVGSHFRDDRCYKRTCEIVRSKADHKIRSNIKFRSTVPDCPTADGGCAGPGSNTFDCFLNGVYDSHCICRKKGAIVYLDSLMRFGKKVPTYGGNANGSYCFFRFKADGETHNECYYGNRTKGKWCAVTDDYDRDRKWGYCTEAPRYRYTKDDLKCKLPFKYNGMLYHDCTKVDSKNGKAWCSTTFQYDPAKTGECEMS